MRCPRRARVIPCHTHKDYTLLARSCFDRTRPTLEPVVNQIIGLVHPTASKGGQNQEVGYLVIFGAQSCGGRNQ